MGGKRGREMDGQVFYDRVAEHGDLEWLGVRQDQDPATDEDEVYVGYSPTGTKFALPVETILTREWDELEAVLTGKRQARILAQKPKTVPVSVFGHDSADPKG